MIDAFDADVLIYAATPGHPLGVRVASVLTTSADRIGSVLLLPELLAKPTRDRSDNELRHLAAVLALLDLRPCDRITAEVAVDLASRYRLRAKDATHLATAVVAGADRFLTNNSRDFPVSITEVDVVYPADLP